MSNQLPDGWFLSTIKDTANKKDKYSFTGGPFGSDLKSEDYTLKGVRILQLQNIGDGVFKNSYKIYTSKAKADALHSCNIYPGDIILSKMGDPVARAVIVPDFSERYVMASDGIRLAVDCARFSTKFVHDMINAHSFRSQAELNSSGTTRKRIGLTQLRELTFPCPPLPEQQKIAAILTSVDDVIEKTQAQINKLKDLKTGMMQELLTRGVGVDGKPHTEFKDSSVGRIPKAWDVVQISELCTDVVDCVNKTAPVVDYKTPYKMLRTTNIKNGRVDTDNVRCVTKETYHTWTRRMKPESGDLIFTREAPVGECGVLKDSKGVFLGQRTMMYRANKTKTSSGYLMYSLMSEYGQKQLENFSGGSTVPHMRVPDCSKILIKLPSLKEQRIIVDSLNSLNFSRQKKEQKVSKLSSLKKALMQDLLTGKVRVNVD